MSSNEGRPRIEAAVIRCYNFESENEENENGDDLSSLSDVFIEADDRNVGPDQNGGTGLSTQLISIDDVTYDRDLKWINVPNGERPKPVILQTNRFLKQAQSITNGNRAELDTLDKHYQSMDNLKRVHEKKFLVDFDTDKPSGKREPARTRGRRGGGRRGGGGGTDGNVSDRRDRGDVDSVEGEEDKHNEQTYSSSRLRSTGRERRGGRGGEKAREETVDNHDTRRRGGGAAKVEGKSARTRGGRRGRKSNNAEPVDSIWDQPYAAGAVYAEDGTSGVDVYAIYDHQHFEESFEPPIQRPHRHANGYFPPPVPVSTADYQTRPSHAAAGRPQPRVPYQHPHSKYNSGERSAYRQQARQAAYSDSAAYGYGDYDAQYEYEYGADAYAYAAPAPQGRYSSRPGGHRDQGGQVYVRDFAAYDIPGDGTSYYAQPYPAPAPQPAQAPHNPAVSAASKGVTTSSEAAYKGQEAKLNPTATEFVPSWAT